MKLLNLVLTSLPFFLLPILKRKSSPRLIFWSCTYFCSTYFIGFLLANQVPPSTRQSFFAFAFFFLPALLQTVRPARAPALDFCDLLTLLLLWFPVEFGYLIPYKISGVPVPEMLMVANALFVFTLPGRFIARPDGGGTIGFNFFWRKSDWKWAGLGLTLFAPFALGLGWSLNFLHPGFRPTTFLSSALLTLGIYFCVALPEEIFFRGLVQNLLERRFPLLPATTWLTASLVFGLAHLNNLSPGFAPPNWRYAILATFAGLVYGLVWRKTGKCTVSALTHATVNILWKLTLSAP